MNICIIAFARLGDSVCKLPALNALKEFFPDSSICMVSQSEKSSEFVTARDVLEGTGLIDSFKLLNWNNTNFLQRVFRLYFCLSMRFMKFDIGIVLMPICRKEDYQVILTLKKYLNYFGCKQIYYPKNIPEPIDSNGKIRFLPHVSDYMLQILSPMGVTLPHENYGRFVMPIRIHESDLASQNLSILANLHTKIRIAVAIGSNRLTNQWPVERYFDVLIQLSKNYDVIPIFFGPEGFDTMYSSFFDKLPNKLVVVGKSIAEVSALIRKCSFYLGNDTGLMHLSVSVGLKCVSIFSARDSPGLWYPYGQGHIVLRSSVVCEGCLLNVCNQYNYKCLKDISVSDVYLACEKMIHTL